MTTLFTTASSEVGTTVFRQRRWVAAAAVFGNIVLTYWSRIQPFNGQSMGYVSGKYPSLLTPAGYAFSIWGIIFLALGIYAVWQLLPAQRTNPLPDAVAKPLILANIATAAWVVVFAYEYIAWCAVIMLIILGALILTYGRARRLIAAGAAPRWTSLPFALYLGWISVASTVNVTIGLRALGWETPTNVTVVLTLGLLAVVTALGLWISRAFSDATVAFVITWALVAVWVARRGAYPELADAALVGAAVAFVGGIGLAWRRQARVTAGV
ncbi:tryptophan-rich sensory protein [Hymenobacter cavernae]|nr:tryptophan-rich sensory protein [Hymenobacter cavernae]